MPDGLGDFVDALNNPKEFLTKEEKRLKQLQDKLGIDEKEISVVPSNKSIKATSANSSSTHSNDKSRKDASNLGSESTNVTEAGESNANSSGAGAQAGAINKKDDPLIEKITREVLKSCKGFQKLLKKQTKEKETLIKKHNKEKAFMQKQHSSIIDKMTANYDKNLFSNNGSAASQGAHIANNNSDESVFRLKMKELVDDQTKSWANMIEKQQSEEKHLNNEHVEQQCACFQQLLQEAQKQRKKEIEIKQKKLAFFFFIYLK